MAAGLMQWGADDMGFEGAGMSTPLTLLPHVALSASSVRHLNSLSDSCKPTKHNKTTQNAKTRFLHVLVVVPT